MRTDAQILVRTHVTENLTPDRHIARTVRRHVIFAVDHALYPDLRVFSAVFMAYQRQISGFHFQGQLLPAPSPFASLP